MEWISVKDRLPEVGVIVLVYCDYGTCCARYHEDFWMAHPVCYEDGTVHGVTHWMPLPPPPED